MVFLAVNRVVRVHNLIILCSFYKSRFHEVKWHNYFLSIFIFTLYIRLEMRDYGKYNVST